MKITPWAHYTRKKLLKKIKLPWWDVKTQRKNSKSPKKCWKIEPSKFCSYLPPSWIRSLVSVNYPRALSGQARSQQIVRFRSENKHGVFTGQNIALWVQTFGVRASGQFLFFPRVCARVSSRSFQCGCSRPWIVWRVYTTS